MRRGTTPTITITTDIDLASAINMFVTFKQNDRIMFEKTLADVEITSESVICNLTQEDTLLLKSGIVRFQIRATLGINALTESTYLADGLHPSASGMVLMYNHIAQELW